jgi:hypothetical protein
MQKLLFESALEWQSVVFLFKSQYVLWLASFPQQGSINSLSHLFQLMVFGQRQLQFVLYKISNLSLLDLDLRHCHRFFLKPFVLAFWSLVKSRFIRWPLFLFLVSLLQGFDFIALFIWLNFLKIVWTSKRQELCIQEGCQIMECFSRTFCN